MEYINYIKKTIDGVITDIYLQDYRIRELLATDVSKALVVYNNGTTENPDYRISTAALNYVPTDSQGKLTNNLDAGVFKIINLNDGTAATDAINKGQLDAAIASLGKILKFIGVVEHFSDLPQATAQTVGNVYIVKKDDQEQLINKEVVGVENSVGGQTVYSWETLGPLIDLTNYIRVDQLASTTGSSTVVPMTQKATTDAINAVSVAKISDPTTKTSGQLLGWNGTSWVAVNINWGTIQGTLSDQTDLVNQFNTKQDDINLSIVSGKLCVTYVVEE